MPNKGKRKRSSKGGSPSTKNVRKLLLSEHSAWKQVDLPYGVHAAGSTGEVGLFSLEELDPNDVGITVVSRGDSRDSNAGGATDDAVQAKKKKKKKSKNASSTTSSNAKPRRTNPPHDGKQSVDGRHPKASDGEDEPRSGVVDGDVVGSAATGDEDVPLDERWSSLPLSDSTIKALIANGFTRPTPIQRKAIHAALSRRRDVIGAAETGSGKTLAFGIPIIEQIHAEMRMRQRTNTVVTRDARTMKALVLVPTRELCVQVGNMLRAVASKLGISVISVFGGMALPKQRRLLAKRPDIVVATPGRYWDLYGEGDAFLSTITDLKYLVIDEADRMIESGYFKELYHILSTLDLTSVPIGEALKEGGPSSSPPVPPAIESDPEEEEDEDEDDDDDDDDDGPSKSSSHRVVDDRRQTFVFSATLTLSRQGRKDITRKKRGKQKRFTGVALLVSRIAFQRKKSVIDLTHKDAVVRTLDERKIECTLNEKDYYLFYILQAHPGRTIVFVNSIDCIRRLVPLFKLFHHSVPVWPLHASMQQRQRLKNLDRFQASPQCALIATDVAARGLDIPHIDHVVHYQLPRTTELYIHRSGRTARASRSGISVMLVCPKEAALYKNICYILGRETGLPDFQVERSHLPRIRRVFDIAREIESMEHAERKKKSNLEWFQKNAKAAGILLDDEILQGVDDEIDEDDQEEIERLESKRKRVLQSLHHQLREELDMPIAREVPGYIPKGFVSTSTIHRVFAGRGSSEMNRASSSQGKRSRNRNSRRPKNAKKGRRR